MTLCNVTLMYLDLSSVSMLSSTELTFQTDIVFPQLSYGGPIVLLCLQSILHSSLELVQFKGQLIFVYTQLL